MKQLQLKKDLQVVAKGLKSLVKKFETVSRKAEKLEKATAKKATAKKATAKPKAKARGRKKVAVSKAAGRKKVAVSKAAGRKTKRVTAGDVVFAAIKKSKKGINTGALKQKTGFAEIKIRNVIFRLKKQGTIKTVGRGLYVAK